MLRGLTVWTLAAAMTVALGASTASAQDTRPDIAPNAEAIAERCANHIERTVRRCVTANEKTTERCVKAIEKALEAGNEDRAKRIARLCARLINRRSHACANHVRRHCRRCVNVLERLGAEELAERIKGLCEDALGKIRESRDASLAALREALGGSDDPALSASNSL